MSHMSQVLALASSGLLVVAALDSIAYAQAVLGQKPTVASSVVPLSRPLDTTARSAPPLYCLTASAACDNTQRIREGEKCSCPGSRRLGFVRKYEKQ